MSLDSIKIKRKYKPVVLIILDGWGLSPSWGGNAINMSNPPNINNYWRQYSHAVLQAFKPIVGELDNIADSEIGHASIGTGRMVKPDVFDINETINKGTFFKNLILLESCKYVKENNSSLHLVGMVSDAGVHSHIRHLFALLDLAKMQNIKKVYIHVITDGRDVTNTSALHYVSALKNKIRMLKNIQIASICGRYYAMDRNNNWDRIETFYKALVFGKGRYEQEPLKAISNLYKEGYTDEFFPPIVIVKNNKPVGIVKNMDAVIYFNFRADRARELTQAFLDKNVFRAFIIRKYPLKKIYFVSLTDYKLDLPLLNVAFPTAKIETSLAKILSEHNFKQLHVAESEKYAHVTYFFNGGYEKPFSGEDRIIVPSPKVKSYDQQPEMSIETLTNKVLKAIKSPKYDFILINFANVDMVGHTGNIIAVSRAVEIVDKKVAEIVNEVLKQNGLIIITADHGNAEQMVNITSSTKDPETIHSLNPVPFILIAKEFRKNLFKSAYKSNELLLTDILSSNHTIADIAPTILDIFNIAKPIDMTGKSLIGKLE